MEDQEFDQFARESAGATTRRTVVRGLAAVLGAASLGAALALDADAGKKSNKRKRRRKRKNKKKQCDFKGRICATPLNPCQTITCQKHKCVSGTAADGTACGDGLVCEAGSCVCPNGVCNVQVTPSSMSSWFGYDDEDDKVKNNLLEFVNGPDNPQHGSGSVEIEVSGTQRRNVATYQLAGTRLADISVLRFTTYNASDTNPGSDSRSAYLHFNVDFFGSDSWQYRLVYVPSDNGDVQPDAWQEWDAIDGGNARWKWSNFSEQWPNNGPDTGDDPKSWTEILATYPDARIRVTDGFFGLRVGEPYPDGFVGNIGSVTFGTGTGTTRFVFGPDS